ncbi:MAG: MFS transporter [Clostridia bacterium]|nr:MFS transporter [Clostridia bacterium]
MNTNAKIIQDKKFNTKLYPFYKALSWDLLFYYSISFLFLTQTKGISAATVLFTDAFYPIFKFILQIPCAAIVGKIGNRKATIIGNILVATSILILFPATGVIEIIISQFFSAFGYALKALTESNLLYDSIPRSKRRNDLFSLIDGKASSYYYYIDAISATATGFLFVINGYLPMIICFSLCVLAVFLSSKFKETTLHKQNSENKNAVTFKDSISDLRQAFSFIFRSSRLRNLILFSSVLTSALAILVTLRSSILTDISLPEQYFGIITAIAQIISGITSARSSWFHKKFRNRTLKLFGMSVAVSMILMGVPIVLGLNFGLTLEILLLLFGIQFIMKGPFYTLIKRYLNSFSTSSMRPKILAAHDVIYSITRAIFTFFGSWLLGLTSTAYVCIILGCIFTILTTLLLDRMRHTVGLKPEEYPEKDIKFTEVH